MSRKSTRTASGAGSIRQRPDGRWEGRYSYRDEYGAYKRGSVYGLTQKECRKKLTEAQHKIDNGDVPKKKATTERYTVGSWLDAWMESFGETFKPSTRASYISKINTRIKPVIGSVPLANLQGIHLQRFYMSLAKGDRPLSPKSIQNIHGIIHSALDQAVTLKLIPFNPSNGLKLPHVEKSNIHPLMDEDLSRFIATAKGDRYENLFLLAIFSGLRQSEILGLQWPDINLTDGAIRVSRQLQRNTTTGDYIWLNNTKSWHARTVMIPPSVCAILESEKAMQMARQNAAGPLWSNPEQIVFTDDLGGHLKHHTVFNHFKRIAREIGRPDVRFHDLRHSYAVAALEAGDNIKSIQEQLGHYSSAFTMDVYADVSAKMRKESQDRMELFIQQLKKD